MKQLLQYFAWPIIAGVLAALLILDYRGGETTAISSQPTASYATAVNRAAPSVVNIYTSKVVKSRRPQWADDPITRRFIPPRARQDQRPQRSLGSGVIVSTDGYILTNEHVISGADEILVSLQDGRESLAELIGSDRETDLALLQIPLVDLQPIESADANMLQVGDVVLAIGNPLGFGHSVSQGIISALGRYGLGLTTYEDYIQTDATINPGSSGGALIDSNGRLLGINTLIYSPTGGSIGIGLATPSNLALFVMRDLVEFGKVIRGWMGLSVQPLISSNQSLNQALLVQRVSSGGPAERAGIAPGDIITHIDGEQVINGRVTMHRIALLRPGDSVEVQIVRGLDTYFYTVSVGTRPEPAAA